MTDPIGRCAGVDAEVHRRLYAALGGRVRRRRGLWWAEGAASPVLPGGGTCSRGVDPADVPAVADFRDSWGELALPAPWRAEPDHAWMLRAPGPPKLSLPPGLRITRASTPAAVLEFEQAVVANAGSPPGHTDGAIHPPGPTAADLSLHLLCGWWSGRLVATALAVTTPAGLYLGAVSTRAELRRRGIGRAMSAAAVAVAPEQPAVLTAAASVQRIYRDLGFRVVGQPVRWIQPAAAG